MFISVVSTNPNTLLGYGTWSAFAAGRMLVGINAADADFDTVEETSGSKSASLAAENIPELTVTITDPGHVHGELAPTTASGGALRFGIDTNASGSVAAGLNTESATTGITAVANESSVATPFTLMNPYIVVYMWKRTA